MTYQDGITIGQKVNETASLMDNQPPVWFTWIAWILVAFMIGATFLRLYMEYADSKEAEAAYEKQKADLILNPKPVKEPFKVGDKVFYKVAGIMSGPMHDILEISECGKYALLGFLMKLPFGWVEVSRLI